jgi:hypothetical protein
MIYLLRTVIATCSLTGTSQVGRSHHATRPHIGYLLTGISRMSVHLRGWPQSVRVLWVRLLIVLLPDFRCGVCLLSGRRPVLPGYAPAPTAPG